MDISLYGRQVEELNRKLTFRRSCYLEEEYEHYHIADIQYSMFSYIQQHPCTTIGSVARALHIDTGNVPALCKKLEHSGYLTRKKKEQDERIVELCTSQSGAPCVQTISRKIQQHCEEQWKQHDYKDKEIIVKELEKLNQFLDTIM